MLGTEVYEVQENIELLRSAVQVIGETVDESKNHNEILMNGYFF